jgi:RNA polymerase sigma-70 factor (ECF subfamily)
MLHADFEVVLKRHQSMVYSIAYRFFHNDAIAEEVAQDVFLQLYENSGSLSSDAHVTAWLRRTAMHRCIDVQRHSRTRREVQVDPLPDVPAAASTADPFLQERLRRLVASLPEKQRAVVILRYGEDLDAEEIGQILQMPVGTVWSHLQRATALLREKAPAVLEGKAR